MNFDTVLINGNQRELDRYVDDTNKTVIVDWRGDDDEIINQIGKKLEGDKLSAEYTETGLLVNYNGEMLDIALPCSMKNRYATIRAAAIILSDKYEIRVFECSLGSDTHVFYVKPKDWWEFMDKNYSERMKEVFVEIEDDLDFGEGRDRFYATGIKE